MTVQEFEWVGDGPTPSSRQEIVIRLPSDQAIRLGHTLMVIARMGLKPVELRHTRGSTR